MLGRVQKNTGRKVARLDFEDMFQTWGLTVLGLLVTVTILGAGLLVNELFPNSANQTSRAVPGVETVVFVPDNARPSATRGKPSPATPDQAERVAQAGQSIVTTSPRPQPRPAPEIRTPRRLAETHAPAARPAGLADTVQAASKATSGQNEYPGTARAHGSDGAAIAAASPECPAVHASGIPGRSANAPSGSAFMSGLSGLGGAERDRRIAKQVLAGNIPAFMRNLTPVTLRSDATTVIICVTPDYVAIGDDRDHVRVPMGLPAAAEIADGLGFMLPTTRMVDVIYADAGVRLTPQPMTPGAQMTSNSYIRRHNATIERQLVAADAVNGTLTAGHRKDLVLSNRLRAKPGRVAIYGWHRINGKPIQPLSTVHGQYYADYSHGVRLVSRTAYVNGRAVDLGDLLSDARYAGLISDEGPIRSPARLIASLSN
jgi:hypothetical protein